MPTQDKDNEQMRQRQRKETKDEDKLYERPRQIRRKKDNDKMRDRDKDNTIQRQGETKTKIR